MSTAKRCRHDTLLFSRLNALALLLLLLLLTLLTLLHNCKLSFMCEPALQCLLPRACSKLCAHWLPALLLSRPPSKAVGLAAPPLSCTCSLLCTYNVLLRSRTSRTYNCSLLCTYNGFLILPPAMNQLCQHPAGRRASGGPQQPRQMTELHVPFICQLTAVP